MRERRRLTRYLFGVTGTLHPAGGRVGTNVVIRDISTQGCELEHAEGSEVGAKCELYFDWQGAHVGLEAQVVWKDAGGRIGLKFLSVDKDSLRHLKELCAALREQPRATPGSKDVTAAPSPLSSGKSSASAWRAETTAPLPPQSGRARRKFPRYISELKAHISNPTTGATSNVTFVNLSVSGVCLEGRNLPGAGQTCELHTEWEGKPLAVRGVVVWKVKDQAGLEFTSLDADTEKLVRQICANLRLQPLAPFPP